MIDEAVLTSLIDFSRDGEWGEGEPGPGLIKARVVRGTDFDAFRRGDLKNLPIRYIPEGRLSAKRLLPGDIIIETAGGTKDRPTGRTVYVRHELIESSDLPLICASFARVIRVDGAQVDPAYLSCWLDHAWKSGLLLRWHVQHTGVARFHWTSCSEALMVPIPERKTQSIAAAAMLAIDRSLSNNWRRREILEEMVNAIYREWFIRFRFPGHERIPFVESGLESLPQDWTVGLLGESIPIRQFKGKISPYDGERVYLATADVSGLHGRAGGSSLQYASLPSRAQLQPAADTVFFARMAGYRKVLLYPTGSSQLATDVLSSGFLGLSGDAGWFAYIAATISDAGFETQKARFATGATQVSLTDAGARRIPWLIPTEQVVQAFGEVALPLLEELIELHYLSENLAKLRDLMLPRLIGRRAGPAGGRLDALLEELAA